MDASRKVRSALLSGCAVGAVALSQTGEAWAQDGKWQPYVEGQGKFGSRQIGGVELFVPLWQDDNSMFFGDLRGRIDDEGSLEGNFGLGYRTIVNGQWIIGGYAFFDVQESENDNVFYQGSLGVEALTEDWDFRLNGYIPTGKEEIVEGASELEISGTEIQLRAGVERALYGGDAEVGYRLPLFESDEDLEARVFLGGYYFNASGFDTVAGPRGRIELRVFDLFANGSRVVVGGEVQWDDPRGTQGFGTIEVRIPLNFFGETKKLQGLDRRMVDPIRRDVDIVTQVGLGEGEAVFVENLLNPTNTIFFADATGGGTGAIGDPTDIDDAVASAGENAIIVVQGDAGTIVDDGDGVDLLDGQALIGGGETVLLTGANTGVQVNFTAPGTRPTIQGTNGAEDLITLGIDNFVGGLNLTGMFDSGISGDTWRTHIRHNDIDSTAGYRGVELRTENPGYGLWLIRENEISNVAGDGISLRSVFTDGLTHLHVAIVDDNTIDAVGGSGIDAQSYTLNNTTAYQQASFSGNTVTNPGNHGIAVNVSNPGYALWVIAENTISGAGYDGIHLGSSFGDGGTHRHVMIVEGNEIDDAGDRGIYLFSNIRDAGTTVYQYGSFSGNTISNSGGHGIYLELDQYAGTTVVQEFLLSGNSISDTVAGDGIRIDSHAEDATVDQEFLIEGNTISTVAGHGIHVYAFTADNATVTSTLAVLDNEIGESFSGIRLRSRAFTDSTLTQDIEIAGNAIAGGEFGIVSYGRAYNTATLTQDVTIVDNVVTDVNVGVDLTSSASGTTGSSDTTVTVTGNDITATNGIGLQNNGFGGGTAVMDATVSGNAVEVSGEVGILLENEASAGMAVMDATVSGNDVETAGEAGIALFNSATEGGAADMGASVSGNEVTGGEVGIVVGSFAEEMGSTTLLDAMVSGNSVHGASDGILVDNTGYNDGIADATVVVSDNDVFDVSGDGIRVENYGIDGDAAMEVAVSGNHVDAGDLGIVLLNVAMGAGGAEMDATLSDNTVTGGSYGLGILNRAGELGSTASLTATVSGNDVGNVDKGITIVNGAYGGIATVVDVAISGSRTDAGEVGIILRNDANSGGTATVQNAEISGNSVEGTPGVGIYVSNQANEAGSTATQYTTVSDNSVTAGGVGIMVFNEADGGTATIETSIFGNDVHVDGVGSVGLQLTNVAELASTANMTANVYGNAIDGSSVGVLVDNYEAAGSTAVQNVSFFDNSVTDSTVDGIAIRQTGDGEQGFDASGGGNTIDGTGDDGIDVYQLNGGSQTVTISGGVTFLNIGDLDVEETNIGGGTQVVVP